jgi:DNA gyrase/topoisomerase IV subunit B
VDNGRGIPVDPYPSGPHKGKSALEVVRGQCAVTTSVGRGAPRRHPFSPRVC